jgi:hypothetical protein
MAQQIGNVIRDHLLPVIGGILGVLAIGLILAAIVLRLGMQRPEPTLPPPQPVPYLECPGRLVEPRQFPLNNLDKGDEFIGRAMASEGITLRIDETFPRWETVSRRHAHIYRDPTTGRVVIEDLGSQNGVYVQGRRTVRNLLRGGWTVDIGGVEFVYHDPFADSSQLPQQV